MDEFIFETEEFKLELEPGQKGKIQLSLPAEWKTADALRVKAVDPHGRLLNTWSWPVKYAGTKAAELVHDQPTDKPVLQETGDSWLVNAGGSQFFVQQN